MNRLERKLLKTLKDLRLDTYACSGCQIRLDQLWPSVNSDDHIEFDALFCSGTTGVLVEITEQQDGNKAKIQKFVRHAELFRKSNVALERRLRLLGLRGAQLNRFEDIDDWRYLYIGISSEVRRRRLTPSRFPDADGRLGILDDEDWTYLLLLFKNIGAIARNELFSALDLDPAHEEPASPSDLTPHVLELRRRRLGPSRDGPRADLFVTSLTARELLATCRVLRYGHLPMALELADAPLDAGYQRLLSREKLRSLKGYVGRDATTSFPTPIVVVGRKCQRRRANGEGLRLEIPNRYGALDVVDGQHRLFAYAELPADVQRKAQLLVTIVQFHNASPAQQARAAAALFVTINRNQAKVKRELIILTSYEALGYSTPEAIAGKVLAEVNNMRGWFEGRFRVRPLARRYGKKVLPIATIANEVADLLDPARIDNLKSDLRTHFFRMAETNRGRFSRKTERVRVGKALVARFLRELERAFPQDISNEDSLLVSPIYLAAFMRRFRQLVTRESRGWNGVRTSLQTISQNACAKTGTKLAFDRRNDAVPELRSGMSAILRYITECE